MALQQHSLINNFSEINLKDEILDKIVHEGIDAKYDIDIKKTFKKIR